MVLIRLFQFDFKWQNIFTKSCGKAGPFQIDEVTVHILQMLGIIVIKFFRDFIDFTEHMHRYS